MKIYYDMTRSFIERACGPHRESGMTRVMHMWGRALALRQEGTILGGLPSDWADWIFEIEPGFLWMKRANFLAGPSFSGSGITRGCLRKGGIGKGLASKLLRAPAFRLSEKIGQDGIRTSLRHAESGSEKFIYHYPLPDTHLDDLPSNCIPVVNIYDIMPIVFRDTYSDYHRKLLSRTIESAKRNRAHIIVNSHDTKHSLVCFFAVEPSRIHVVALGADLPPAPPSEDFVHSERPYLLYVASSGQRRKNVASSILGFGRFLEESGASADLVIVGPGTEAFQDLGDRVTAGHDARVRCMGSVDDSTLDKLYRSARVGLYLSLYEGFGLPVLECMQKGVPVICGDRTSLPEVAGDAALLVDSLEPSAIAAGIAKVWSDEAFRMRLIELGSRRAASYSWSASFSALFSVYEAIFQSEQLQSASD